MGLFNYLKDEEALFALGLLTEGSKGKTIGDAAMPSLITAPKKDKVGKRTISDEVLKVYDKVKLFTKENFNEEFGKLTKPEQSIYKNKIEGNVDAINAAIADKIENTVTLQPDQLVISSGYKLTDTAGDTYESVAELVQGQMEANPGATFEQALQSLITAGLIEE